MATSGTTAFNLDFTDIAEEAWERAGRELRSGYDLATARRSMNLLTIEWQNRGINLWTIDSGQLSLVSGTARYAMPSDTIDLLEQAIRTNDGTTATQNDVLIPRISVSTYAAIPNKLTTGKSSQVYVERLYDAVYVNLWPVPNNSTDIFQYWRLRRVEDAGNGVENPDMNFRFYPALVAGLAYYISMKVPELIDRVPMLKQEYTEQFQLAAEEDRDKTSARFVPRIVR
tara:strand:+ start:5319 stop:6002 length:684 start_codon:yes stop_codon:yes gene_type:complete